ncbi:MAG: 50S ribosomal protein L20 [Planctomycetes bacterium]|jgi:large subunit ribosomal protein L20|nr:50S ribosomal protein L20 [Planctomycetota bacterium]MCB9935213.1 50S ribosomal protein L20 [Planctomycetota bacterium]MCZ7607976.1 50S ribosomal protein L20 [Planctomycetota bacterium]
MPHSVSRTTRKRRHKKIRKLASGYWGRRKNYRQARVAVERAWRYAWFHRALRKRDFRRLWITRLSAAARANGVTYSNLINLLKKGGIELNRKSLSELAIRDPQAFSKVVQAAKGAK